MYGYIYCTYCFVTQKMYVGQKKSNRFLGEKYLGSGKNLKKEIEKYGEENFIVLKIDTAESQDELNEKEKYWIKVGDMTNPIYGYNISAGGQYIGPLNGSNNPMYGKHHSEETKEKIRQKATGRKKSQEAINKRKVTMLAKGGMGYYMDDEYREQIRQSKLGRRCYNNGIIEVRRYECPEGFVPGMLKSNVIKQHQFTKGYHYYNNGKITIMCNEDNVPDGFTPGRLSIKGWGWYNNGQINKRAPVCPEGFVPGRIKKDGN